ncbi:hypothetical protein STEG23_030364 [Scotinomys teguina]
METSQQSAPCPPAAGHSEEEEAISETSPTLQDGKYTTQQACEAGFGEKVNLKIRGLKIRQKEESVRSSWDSEGKRESRESVVSFHPQTFQSMSLAAAKLHREATVKEGTSGLPRVGLLVMVFKERTVKKGLEEATHPYRNLAKIYEMLLPQVIIRERGELIIEYFCSGFSLLRLALALLLDILSDEVMMTHSDSVTDSQLLLICHF